MKSSPARVSLRRRLQTSSLLAVLVGFAVLLLAQRELLDGARAQRHRQAAELVRQELLQLSPGASPLALQSRLDRVVSPGRLLWFELLPGQPLRRPRPDVTFPLPIPLPQLINAVERVCVGDNHLVGFTAGGRHYLCSSERLNFSDRPGLLRVLEDISADVESQRTVLLLLLAAAGASSLFISMLLRLVFRRTLRPLDQLSTQLGQIDAESLEQTRLTATGQPEELQPIVVAFNALLDRLAAGRQRQQAFVDGVAHEMRTPITLISGYAQSLRRHAVAAGQPDADALAPLARIEAEGQRMGRLVADLLDIAREDAGRLELRRAPLDVDEALLEAFERLSLLAGGRLRLHPPPDDDALAMGDAERLQQCLTNLVENAIKYTPANQPIELLRSSTDTQVIVHVRDHGPGVAMADRERIFQRFVRASSAASGSGIGLAVVKLLMERMGGAVRVCEAPGGGAEFRLGLERAEPISPSGSLLGA